MKKYRHFLLPLLVLLFLVYLLLYPQRALEGSRSGLTLWFNTILPTLLPYMIASNLLLTTDLIPRILSPIHPLFSRIFGLSVYGSYGLFLGLLCGYPMGAKVAADLYTSGKITSREAHYLLSIANGPSPAFLLTYVLGDSLQIRMGIGRVLLAYYGSLLASALLLRRFTMGKECSASSAEEYKKETSHLLSLGEKIDVSVMNGFETITRLGGYIILCSIAVTATGILPDTLKLPGLFLGILTEITTGIHTICKLPLTFIWKLTASMGASTLGGLCILMQTKSVIHSSGLSLLPYVKGKILQTGMVTALLLFLH